MRQPQEEARVAGRVSQERSGRIPGQRAREAGGKGGSRQTAECCCLKPPLSPKIPHHSLGSSPMASLLSLKPTCPAPTSGPLHWLFPLPGTLFLQMSMWLPPHLLQAFAQRSPPQGVPSGHRHEDAPAPGPACPLLGFIFLHGTHHHLAYHHLYTGLSYFFAVSVSPARKPALPRLGFSSFSFPAVSPVPGTQQVYNKYLLDE